MVEPLYTTPNLSFVCRCRNLLFNSKTLQEYWGFHGEDSLLHTLPLYHVHGLFVALNTALMTGCHMTILPKFNAKEIIRHLPSSTVLMGIPTYYSRLLSEKLFSKDTIGPRMRLFVSGSAPLTIHCWHEFKKRSGYAILERYCTASLSPAYTVYRLS